MPRQVSSKSIKKIIVAVIFIVIIAAALIKYESVLAPSVIPLEKVTVARTDAEKARGLGGKESLPAENGMLFIFDHSDNFSFWMKDMKFPIDIIWLDENLHVVYVKMGATPQSYPENFTPTHKSKYVLEVAEKVSEKNHYTVGQQLDFLKPYIYTN